MRKAWATSALILIAFMLFLFNSNVGMVSGFVTIGNSPVYQNQIFDIFGLSSSSVARVGHLYSGSGCVSSNLVQTQPAEVNIPPVYIIGFGGEPPGPYSIEVDGDSPACGNFNILPFPTTTVTVTNTITAPAKTITLATTVTVFSSSVVEYPYGLPILGILMIMGYAVIRHRTSTKRVNPGEQPPSAD